MLAVGLTLAKVGAFIASMLLVGAGCSRACSTRWRAPARASCSRCA